MMASPLKFLRRLVSRRGEPKQVVDKVDEATPDVWASAGPTETVAKEGFGDASCPASPEPPRQDPSDPVSAETATVDEAETGTDTADGVRASIPAVGGSASANETGIAATAAYDAAELDPAVAGVTRKRRGHGKNTRPVVVPAEVSQGPRAPSDETISLDEEIKVLREQLAERLRIQNAQLKKMLERFEP